MFRVAFAAAVLALVSIGGAHADSKILTGAYGQADLARACVAAGGHSTTGPDSYSCVKDNCDGKGGQCSVTCVEPTKCLAQTPARLTGSTSAAGALLNGRLKPIRTPGLTVKSP